jgi:D-xylulose kinase
MKVVLIPTLPSEFDKVTKSPELIELGERMEEYFKMRQYGDAILEYFIGIVCVHPKYDSIFTIKRPRYTEDKRVMLDRALGEVHFYKTLGVDVKLDFATFIKSDKEGGLKMVADPIIDRLNTKKYPAKVKEFDKERFLNDLKNFFQEEINYNPS